MFVAFSSYFSFCGVKQFAGVSEAGLELAKLHAPFSISD